MHPGPLRRGSLRAAALGVTAVLSLSLGAPPARADPTDPLWQLLSPSVEDPVITLLSPLPTPYPPYTGSACASGDPECMVDVTTEMGARVAPEAAACDHDA